MMTLPTEPDLEADTAEPGLDEPREQGGLPPAEPAPLSLPVPIALLGVPFDRVTTAETLRLIGQMVAAGRPRYAATANVDFVVQALEDVELRRILTDADLVLCDGMPLVWASRLMGNPLPERVAGSDLVPELLAEAERQGWRVFFLGGAEESVARAAEKVRARHPKLRLVGAYSPPFQPLLEMDDEDILRRVRAARPDILLVAFGCPKQEKWINRQFRRSGVPLSIGVGATIDFLAGSVRRAPVWMRRSGLEWTFRLLQEPRRLVGRYLTDLWVFSRAMVGQWWQLRGLRSQTRRAHLALTRLVSGDDCEIVRCAERLDAVTAREQSELWDRLSIGDNHLLFDLSRVRFVDSTGVGLLIRMQKQLRAAQRHLVLIAPTKPVLRSLNLMGLSELFSTVSDLDAGRALVRERCGEQNVAVTVNEEGLAVLLAWHGDIVAANEEQIWHLTRKHLPPVPGGEVALSVDLAGVRFIDSTGVRLMVRLRKEAQERGRQLRFSDPSPAVRNVLRILRMEAYLLN